MNGSANGIGMRKASVPKGKLQQTELNGNGHRVPANGHLELPNGLSNGHSGLENGHSGLTNGHAKPQHLRPSLQVLHFTHLHLHALIAVLPCLVKAAERLSSVLYLPEALAFARTCRGQDQGALQTWSSATCGSHLQLSLKTCTDTERIP